MPDPIKTILTVVGVLVYFASGVILGIIAEAMAKGKGYKGLPHLITCILFNILGFIGACALPDRKNNEKILQQLKAINAALGGVVEEEKEERYSRRAREEETVYEEEPKRAPRPVEVPRMAEPPRPVRPAPTYYEEEPTQSGYFSSRMNVSSEPAKPVYSADATAQVVFKDGAVCCSRCNGKIKLNATACPNCGAKIVSSSNSGGLGYIKPLK